MKKILTYLRSQKGLFTVGAVTALCFVIGLINTMGFGVNSYDEMFWWGKLVTWGFSIGFGIMTIAFGIAPIVYGIGQGIKKLFGPK